MTWVAVAIGGSAVIGAGASIAGSNRQAGAARDSAQLQMDQWRTLNEQQQPFIQSGYGANTELMRLLGIGGTPGGFASGGGSPLSYEDWTSQQGIQTGGAGGVLGRALGRDPRASYDEYVSGFQPGSAPDSSSEGYGSLLRPFGVDEFNQFKDPGYNFRRQQGEQSVLNSASAGSGAMSGAALKDLLSFNSDLASTEYGNAFNRYQTQQGNIFQRLSSLTNLGQNAAANVGQQGTALASGAGQSLTDAGTAAGAGIVGAGNAISGGLSNYWLSNLIRPPAGGTGP